MRLYAPGLLTSPRTYTIAALATNTVPPGRNSTLLRAISSGFFESSTVIGKLVVALCKMVTEPEAFFRKPSGGLQDVEKAGWPPQPNRHPAL